MKKLYKKSTVHPTPSDVSEHLLSFLPAAILAWTVALTPDEREVLDYLISCPTVNSSGSERRSAAQKAVGGGSKGGDDHETCFNCICFKCYKSYWVQWDASPNRQLIHEVIDAYEESLVKENKKEKNRKERRKGKTVKAVVLNEAKNSQPSLTAVDFGCTESNTAAENGGESGYGGGGGREEEEEAKEHYDNTEEEFEKSTVRRFLSFLGEKILSVWGKI